MMVTRIAVVGAGIGGLTVALSFRQRGFSVCVFEQAPEPGEVGAGIQVSPNGMHVLTQLGVAAALEKVACEPPIGSLRHHRTGKPYFSTPMRDYQRRYGAKYLHIHRADLIDALYRTARSAGVEFHFAATASCYTQDAAKIVLLLRGGASHEADLLVGADGIHSTVRTHMIGMEQARFTGQVAWRGLVPADRLPPGTVPFAASAWLGPGRHFVSYYVRGGTLINFVAVETRAQWANESWHERGDMEEVRAAFAGWDTVVEELLQAGDTCHLWGLFDRDPLPVWHDGRAVLVGDACHPMLPFMAQGGAMSMEDGYVLAAVVDQPGRNLEAALVDYERRRQPRTSRLQKISRRNARMFHLSGPLECAVRQLQFGIGKLFPAAIMARLDSIYGVNVVRELPAPRS